ncbi:glutathione S-transferase N-terminal domain-containing protein [Hydrogenophaga sp.]|uniref:glutathione S-transferase N-terminal domain-containing protein n=1 Tax=Hydrogenophaga sp. TaxID=1904254 RepID=UPI003AF9A0A8
MQLLANTTSPYVRLARMALIEKGVEIEPTIVDPWADDPRLREANAATRVPTLVLDDGTPLAESLLIVQWLEATRPDAPSLLGADAASVLSRTGVALGVIDAAVHTIIIRKVTAPTLFDDTPVGVRRRRSMREGMERLEAMASSGALSASGMPRLDVLAAIDALDYLDFRFTNAPWLPDMPALRALAGTLAQRPSVQRTRPH